MPRGQGRKEEKEWERRPEDDEWGEAGEETTLLLNDGRGSWIVWDYKGEPRLWPRELLTEFGLGSGIPPGPPQTHKKRTGPQRRPQRRACARSPSATIWVSDHLMDRSLNLLGWPFLQLEMSDNITVKVLVQERPRFASA